MFSLVVMYASRFRNCVCAERNRTGGAGKKRGSQRPRATLRREVHAAQEFLKARAGPRPAEQIRQGLPPHPGYANALDEEGPLGQQDALAFEPRIGELHAKFRQDQNANHSLAVHTRKEQRQTATNRICPKPSRAFLNWGAIGFPQQATLPSGSGWISAAERVGLVPLRPVSAGFRLIPHISISLLDLSGSRVCIDLRRGRFRHSAGSGPRQEEQGTPTDFLIEFGAASLKGQPYPFHLVFVRRFAESAVHLQRRVFREPQHRNQADAQHGPTACGHGAREHWHTLAAELWGA